MERAAGGSIVLTRASNFPAAACCTSAFAWYFRETPSNVLIQPATGRRGVLGVKGDFLFCHLAWQMA
jgi:hypothetical protein